MRSATSRLHMALVGLCALSVAAGTSAASTSATAVYAGTLNADSNYDYQLVLTNTGTTPIQTLWFAWVPYSSFLPNTPFPVTAPAAWSGQVVSDYYGNSILWDTAGAGLAPGASLGGFNFTSPDSPDVLAGLDSVYGYYPVTSAYVYAGTVANPNATLPTQFGTLTAVAGVVPEPAMAAVFFAASSATRRRR